MTEIERIKSEYWWYTPAGIPLPGFLREVVVTDGDKERFNAWYRRLGSRMAQASFSLEVLYRRAGRVTMIDLDPGGFGGWCWRVEATGQNIEQEAMKLEREYGIAYDVVRRERWTQEQAKIRRRFDASHAAKLQRELAAKALPTGKEANLALIRRTLKI